MTVVTEKLLIYCPRARRRVLRRARRSRDRADRGGQQLPFLVDHLRHRQQHSISDSGDRSHDHQEDGTAASRHAAWAGRRSGVAAARCDGPCALGRRQGDDDADQAPWIRLRAERREHGDLDAADRPAPTSSLSPTLTPLAPFQNQMVVATGLSNKEADSQGDGSGEHPRASAGWLTGVHAKRTEGADILAGTSADQIAAREIGKDTPLPSLEIGLESNYGVGNCDNGYSLRLPEHCLVAHADDASLIGSQSPRDLRAALRRRRQHGRTAVAGCAQTRSILDWVMEDTARLRKSLGASDQHTVDQYLDSVREIERRIQKSEAKAAASTMPTSLQRPVGVPETYDEHARLMYDLQWLAYQVDATRVFTFVMGRGEWRAELPGQRRAGSAPRHRHITRAIPSSSKKSTRSTSTTYRCSHISSTS